MEKSKEQLEKEKLQVEIDQLATPFYLKPAFLSIITSSLFAAITIYVTLRISTSERLSQIDKRELDIRTRELKIREDSLKNSIGQLESKINTLDEVYETKEATLIADFKEKSDSLDEAYFLRLKEVQGELAYIEKYMINYADGYSRSLVFDLESTKDTVRKYVPHYQSQFAQWLEGSIKEAIRKSNSRTLQKINLKINVEEYKLKN